MNYFNDYINSAISQTEPEGNQNIKKLKNRIFDLVNVIVDAFIILCDYKQGYQTYSKKYFIII
jgi:hypothetical protein